jgi:hypothetical protein
MYANRLDWAMRGWMITGSLLPEVRKAAKILARCADIKWDGKRLPHPAWRKAKTGRLVIR